MEPEHVGVGVAQQVTLRPLVWIVGHVARLEEASEKDAIQFFLRVYCYQERDEFPAINVICGTDPNSLGK